MKQLIELNRCYDQLPAASQRLWLIGLLVVAPILVTFALDASFEDESAQLIWLVWTVWLVLPRIWYCHTTGRSPWKRP